MSTPPPRLFNLDPDLNKQVGETFCAMCSRTLKKAAVFSVWSSNFIEAVHPEDIQLVNKLNASGPCALIPIGDECAKKIPDEYLVRN